MSYTYGDGSKLAKLVSDFSDDEIRYVDSAEVIYAQCEDISYETWCESISEKLAEEGFDEASQIILDAGKMAPSMNELVESVPFEVGIEGAWEAESPEELIANYANHSFPSVETLQRYINFFDALDGALTEAKRLARSDRSDDREAAAVISEMQGSIDYPLGTLVSLMKLHDSFMSKKAAMLGEARAQIGKDPDALKDLAKRHTRVLERWLDRDPRGVDREALKVVPKSGSELTDEERRWNAYVEDNADEINQMYAELEPRIKAALELVEAGKFPTDSDTAKLLRRYASIHESRVLGILRGARVFVPDFKNSEDLPLTHVNSKLVDAYERCAIAYHNLVGLSEI